MKNYEKEAELEKRKRWSKQHFHNYESQVGHLMGELAKMKDLHSRMQLSLIKEIELLEADKAAFYDEYQNRKKELQEFRDKGAKKAPEAPVVNENGKKICDLCGEEFASQGYPGHRKKCERIHELEKELELLETEE